jgi:hypothetical protein
MSTRSYIGIKNSDGSLELAYCQFDGYPSDKMPMLTTSYGTEELVRKLIAKGGFRSLVENPDGVDYYANHGEEIDILKYKDIHELRDSFTTGEAYSIEYVYIWCDGTWTCASGSSDIFPLDCFGKEGEVSANDLEDLQSYPFDKWIAEYFTVTPEEKHIPTVSRLSKEEWLRQHYPDLRELPKWRFPALMAA